MHVYGATAAAMARQKKTDKVATAAIVRVIGHNVVNEPTGH